VLGARCSEHVAKRASGRGAQVAIAARGNGPRAAKAGNSAGLDAVRALARGLRSQKAVTRTDGFTLVDALIGLSFAGAVCASAALALASARTIGVRARHDTIGVAMARSRLSELAALRFSTIADASGVLGFATDTTSDLSVDPPRPGGPGLTPSPPDALVVDRPGYADYLDDTGRAIGADPTSRARATYVRRWAIVRHGAGTGELAVFAVLVAPIAVADRLAAAGPIEAATLAAQPGVVCLRGARARQAS
jgi:hypothetical protein